TQPSKCFTRIDNNTKIIKKEMKSLNKSDTRIIQHVNKYEKEILDIITKSGKSESILVQGPSGVGKTRSIKRIAKYLNISIIYQSFVKCKSVYRLDKNQINKIIKKKVK